MEQPIVGFHFFVEIQSRDSFDFTAEPAATAGTGGDALLNATIIGVAGEMHRTEIGMADYWFV